LNEGLGAIRATRIEPFSIPSAFPGCRREILSCWDEAVVVPTEQTHHSQVRHEPGLDRQPSTIGRQNGPEALRLAQQPAGWLAVDSDPKLAAVSDLGMHMDRRRLAPHGFAGGQEQEWQQDTLCDCPGHSDALGSPWR
jgi:hypothetical protein